jgi:L-rhamnose mutarotase
VTLHEHNARGFVVRRDEVAVPELAHELECRFLLNNPASAQPYEPEGYEHEFSFPYPRPGRMNYCLAHDYDFGEHRELKTTHRIVFFDFTTPDSAVAHLDRKGKQDKKLPSVESWLVGDWSDTRPRYKHRSQERGPVEGCAMCDPGVDFGRVPARAAGMLCTREEWEDSADGGVFVQPLPREVRTPEPATPTTLERAHMILLKLTDNAQLWRKHRAIKRAAQEEYKRTHPGLVPAMPGIELIDKAGMDTADYSVHADPRYRDTLRLMDYLEHKELWPILEDEPEVEKTWDSRHVTVAGILQPGDPWSVHHPEHQLTESSGGLIALKGPDVRRITGLPGVPTSAPPLPKKRTNLVTHFIPPGTRCPLDIAQCRRDRPGATKIWGPGRGWIMTHAIGRGCPHWDKASEGSPIDGVCGWAWMPRLGWGERLVHVHGEVNVGCGRTVTLLRRTSGRWDRNGLDVHQENGVVWESVYLYMAPYPRDSLRRLPEIEGWTKTHIAAMQYQQAEGMTFSGHQRKQAYREDDQDDEVTSYDQGDVDAIQYADGLAVDRADEGNVEDEVGAGVGGGRGFMNGWRPAEELAVIGHDWQGRLLRGGVAWYQNSRLSLEHRPHNRAFLLDSRWAWFGDGDWPAERKKQAPPIKKAPQDNSVWPWASARFPSEEDPPWLSITVHSTTAMTWMFDAAMESLLAPVETEAEPEPAICPEPYTYVADLVKWLRGEVIAKRYNGHKAMVFLASLRHWTDRMTVKKLGFQYPKGRDANAKYLNPRYVGLTAKELGLKTPARLTEVGVRQIIKRVRDDYLKAKGGSL